VAGLESDVLNVFTASLEDSAKVPVAVIAELRVLLSEDKLPKQEELVTLYGAESGDRRA